MHSLMVNFLFYKNLSDFWEKVVQELDLTLIIFNRCTEKSTKKWAISSPPMTFWWYQKQTRRKIACKVMLCQTFSFCGKNWSVGETALRERFQLIRIFLFPLKSSSKSVVEFLSWVLFIKQDVLRRNLNASFLLRYLINFIRSKHPILNLWMLIFFSWILLFVLICSKLIFVWQSKETKISTFIFNQKIQFWKQTKSISI